MTSFDLPLLISIDNCDIENVSKVSSYDMSHMSGCNHFLNTALKTGNKKLIKTVLQKVSEIHDLSYSNIMNVNFSYISQHKMYDIFHLLTLEMAHIAPDYCNEFCRKLGEIKKLPDKRLIEMADTTIDYLSFL